MKEQKEKLNSENEETKKDAGALSARALIFLVAACTAVGAVLCFRFGFAPGRLAIRILLFVGGSLLGVFSCISWFIFAATLHTERRNLFLYDSKTKTEIPVEELSWEQIEDRLSGCFAYYFANRRRLAAMPEVLHPLFLPFYLLQFKDAGEPDVDRLLQNKEMIDSAVPALEKLGLGDDGRQLLYHYGSYSGDTAPFRAFLSSAEPRFREKITDYIKTNIDEFV